MPAENLLIIIGSVAVFLLIIIVIKLFTGKKDESDRNFAAVNRSIEETRNDIKNVKADLINENERVKNEVNAALGNLANKTDAFTQQNHATQIKVTEGLASMQEKINASGKENAEAVSRAIEKLQQSNEKKLDEMRATVDEKLTGTLNERLDSSFKTVSEQLSNVYKSLGEMQQISGGINSLNRVLSGVKTRGNWAETQLEGLLDQIIPGMYVKNYRPGNSGEVVEFAVTIPSTDGGQAVYMPIDSKFPMEDYLRLCDASDAGDAEAVIAARKALEARVALQAREVKKYIVPPETTPFAVLYLATDSLYAEVVSSKSNLADKLHSEYNILLTGPSTVTALLSSLAMGFRTIALNEKANEVMKLLGAAKTQYDKFAEALESVRKNIDAAGKKLDAAQHRNEMIVKSLKNVESLDADISENLLN
ncbi:MAG: DNA recombination protein RmuC [Oscillospiraceae bacterium]|nr:DNA recombination protein RmuC [Oscillospiraceae bacterium]